MPVTVACEPALLCLPGKDPAHARRARRWVREVLDAWGGTEYGDLSELIVSELVTNAVCHGDGPIDTRVAFAHGHLQVEVHDHGAERPVRKHAGTDEECGRGLELLDGLIELHGGERGMINDQGGPGKTVYVVLAVEASPADVT
jgi:signal transduction histidine kinase